MLSLKPEKKYDQEVIGLYKSYSGDDKLIFYNDLDEEQREKINQVNLNIIKQNNNSAVQINPKEIKVRNKSSMFIPTTKRERDVIYITGKSGCGKSHVTSRYCDIYHEMYPKRDIFLFSKKTEDPLFDKRDYVKRIEIIPEELEHVKVEDFKKSLVIFDDCLNIKGKEKEVVQTIEDDILELGRSYKISCIITRHQLTNFRKSRMILNEAEKFVVFPKYTRRRALQYLFEEYIGIANTEITKMLKKKSRWFCINTLPNISVIHENGAYIPQII